MKKIQGEKLPTQRAEELLNDYVESSGSDRAILVYVLGLLTEIEQLKQALKNQEAAR